VRFHGFLAEDLAHRAVAVGVGEARMALLVCMLAGVASQKPRRPPCVGIAKLLRLLHANDASHAQASSVIEGSRPGLG
jgi:hypothetical protein